MVLVAACEPGPLRVALSWAPLRALGRISYGIYVIHWPVFLLLDAARTGVDGLALTTLRMATTVALATASFLWLERPVREGRRVVRPRPWIVVPAVVAGASATVVIASVLASPVIVYAPATSSAAFTRGLSPDRAQPPHVGAG